MRIVVVPAAQSLSPDAAPPPGPAVVIDALRATSTIVAALSAGALWVEPVETVDAARARASALPEALLAGERHGDPLPGFALGNSPVEAAERTPGRGIVLTTTNGTLAAARLSAARAGGDWDWPVLACALTNVAAVAAAVEDAAADPGADTVTIVCAGQDGHPAAEDLLVAGCLADRLPQEWALDDLACLARWAWLAAREDPHAALVEAPHGATLAAKGYDADLAACADLDRHEVAPRLQAMPFGPPRFVL